jgi:LmbE family N-acetylglucosaminyl deacetylase
VILGDSVTILSPHLDDAVLSLGAAIARATRSGAAVEVVTVFAGDPDASMPSGTWDARSGFQTCGEAIRTRRSEDLRACRLLGASTHWLPFADLQYEPPLRAEVAQALTPIFAAASTILTPGFPMTNPDHRVVTELALELAPASARLGV